MPLLAIYLGTVRTIVRTVPLVVFSSMVWKTQKPHENLVSRTKGGGEPKLPACCQRLLCHPTTFSPCLPTRPQLLTSWVCGGRGGGKSDMF